jgi:hypothetical protein
MLLQRHTTRFLMRVCMLWQPAGRRELPPSGYAYDVERYATLTDAVAAFRRRRLAPRAWVYFGGSIVGGPDRELSVGPRGGIVLRRL